MNITFSLLSRLQLIAMGFFLITNTWWRRAVEQRLDNRQKVRERNCSEQFDGLILIQFAQEAPTDRTWKLEAEKDYSRTFCREIRW